MQIMQISTLTYSQHSSTPIPTQRATKDVPARIRPKFDTLSLGTFLCHTSSVGTFLCHSLCPKWARNGHRFAALSVGNPLGHNVRTGKQLTVDCTSIGWLQLLGGMENVRSQMRYHERRFVGVSQFCSWSHLLICFYFWRQTSGFSLKILEN